MIGNSIDIPLPSAGVAVASDRSSVFNVQCEFFTTGICKPQEIPTSGKYDRQFQCVIDAMSTHSGLCLVLKASPTVVRNRSQLFAEYSLRDAALVSKDIATVAQSIISSLPHLPPGNGRRFFGDQSERLFGSCSEVRVTIAP